MHATKSKATESNKSKEKEKEAIMNDVHEVSTEEIRTKIVHLLTIYPIISPTMLQGGLGPAMKPVLWRPVLDQMLKDGVVIQEQESMLTPTERYNTYTKLHLPGVTITRDE